MVMRTFGTGRGLKSSPQHHGDDGFAGFASLKVVVWLRLDRSSPPRIVRRSGHHLAAHD